MANVALVICETRCRSWEMYEEVKRDIRLGDVLTRYGIWHPDREQYRIACPIHHGKDFNFSVSESDGLWNCFSVCGRGGSVIDLVAALEDIEPKEAVRKLATEFHITPAHLEQIAAREYSSKHERWTTVRNSVATIGSEAVEGFPRTRQLGEGYRGLSARTIEHWGLARTDDGVFIPLLNSKGDLCSYSIRRDDGHPKYDNAAGSSNCPPMGLFENKADIIREGFCYVTEGQFDCISMWQNGFRNVVGLRGSHLGETQAMLLLVLTSKLTLVLDGDEAGRSASIKIASKWGNVFDINTISLPEGKDPDDFSREELLDILV